MFLAIAESDALERLVARVEARTGIQVVASVVGKSDVYAELPWKAFALGASLAACVVVVADLWRPEWITARTALVHTVAVLAAGASCALAAVFVPPFARLLLHDERAAVEVRQYAESLFLTRGLFATAERTGVLLLVSLFERRVEILSDRGFEGRLGTGDWRALVDRMAPHLRRRHPFDALRDGLESLEDLLVQHGFAGSGTAIDELPNRPLDEAGA